jgi:NTP pyrophosphatase (non-canonical NTP hydrolase)
MIDEAQDIAIGLIREKRAGQREEWGNDSQNGPGDFLRYIVEELGEVARAMSFGDTAAVVAELVDVAATSTAMIEWCLRATTDRKDRDGNVRRRD